MRSLRWLERLLRKRVLSAKEVDVSKIRKILVIRQHDQLGDFLLATPVLRALRGRFPAAKIGLLVREYFSDVACCVPFADEVLVFREKVTRWNLRSISVFLSQLRQDWDLVIVLNTVSHSLTSDILAYCTSARYILGSETRPFPGCERNFFYNLIAPVRPTSTHQSEQNLDIVRYLGIDTLDLSEIVQLPEAEVKKAHEEMEKLGVRASRPVVGIHPGAGKPVNRWPVRNFSEVAAILHDVHHVQIVLFWGPAEQDLSDQFCELLAFKPIKIPPSNLRTLAAYFTRCNALISNDTGVMHLAAATGVPVVSLFGATNPAEWKPVGETFIGLRGRNGVIGDVDTDRVLHALERLLGERLGPSRSARSHVPE